MPSNLHDMVSSGNTAAFAINVVLCDIMLASAVSAINVLLCDVILASAAQKQNCDEEEKY